MAPTDQSSPIAFSAQHAMSAATRPASAAGPYGKNSYGNLRSVSAQSSRASVESSIVLSTTTAVKCEVMIQYLRQRQIEKLWTDGSITEGVILKRAKNDFVSQPQELQQQVFGFFDEIRKLNIKVRCALLLLEHDS